MSAEPSQLELLELDIDVRMAELWAEASRTTGWTLEMVGIFMRAAYGKGYCDALIEPERGSLCYDHGYRIPG